MTTASVFPCHILFTVIYNKIADDILNYNIGEKGWIYTGEFRVIMKTFIMQSWCAYKRVTKPSIYTHIGIYAWPFIFYYWIWQRVNIFMHLPLCST